MRISLADDAEKDPELLQFLEKHIGERRLGADKRLLARNILYEGEGWSISLQDMGDKFRLNFDGRKLRGKIRTEFILKWGG